MYIYGRILLSHNKKWNLAICDNMDGPLEGIMLKWNKSDKDKCHMISLIRGIYKTKIDEWT